MGEKLLRSRHDRGFDEHDISELIRKLTEELHYHGHPINRKEAREEIGLSFVEDATSAVADRMWELYEAFDADMHLNEEFAPLFRGHRDQRGAADPTAAWPEGRTVLDRERSPPPD